MFNIKIRRLSPEKDGNGQGVFPFAFQKAQGQNLSRMKKRFFVIPLFFAFSAIVFSGCAGTPETHTYWLKNEKTGTYSKHATYSRLSADEIRELGLVKELPEGAKTID